MPGKNGKIHKGSNGFNGVSLQHYFIAVASDNDAPASKKAWMAERDIVRVGGEQIRIKQFGFLARVHFSLPPGSVGELTGKGHTVHTDYNPYLDF